MWLSSRISVLQFAALCFISHVYGIEPTLSENGAGSCIDEMRNPKFCYPPFKSAAAGRYVNASNTCGLRGRRKFCIHMSNAATPSRCQYCDNRNSDESHDAIFLTDKNHNNWWQSETMDENPYLHFSESVTLTVDLGTQFHVNYVYLQFKSPRPHAMIIHKRFSDSSPWMPWAYFSSNCYTYYNMTYEMLHQFTRPDEVICREEYSTLQPLYDGEVVFSVINGRPGYEKFFENPALQQWSTASQIKIELQKMHTFGDERNAERDTLLTYYFAVRKLTVGGRCMCNGHGGDCQPVSGSGPNPKLVCVCDPLHHTVGDNCEQCAPGYNDIPWAPAFPSKPNACKACECNGNSQQCEFNQEEFDRTGSGGICRSCGNNTHGKNCEKCLKGHFRHASRPAICIPCSCDPVGTLEGSAESCSEDGQCRCKPGVGGSRCDQCLPDHFGFTASGCQACNCNLKGSRNGKAECNPTTGDCYCKENVIGKQCSSCKPGHFGLMSNDPLGCKKCYCHGHSSECSLGLEKSSIVVPADSNELVPYEKPDQVIFSCPNGTSQCDVCLIDDKVTLDIGCHQNDEGQLTCLCRANSKDCNFCISQAWRKPQAEIRNEICKCPPQLTGNSCEFCGQGYRREPINGRKTDMCIPCTCNNLADTCHPDTGDCDCKFNAGGPFCDRCKDGYYGDPTKPPGSTKACQPCPCPQGSKCVETKWPEDKIPVVCTDCPDNRTGVRCKRCAENFFGDPINGVPCEPCQCSGNIDLRAFGNCDSRTGECNKCLFGTDGRHCERCLPGYRRNPKAPGQNQSEVARGCQPCQCDPRGTLAIADNHGFGVCDEDSGQCKCKPGVTGLQCDKCRPGFFGYESGKGCKECWCSPIGAKTDSCDVKTGVCDCLPLTTGRACDECLPGFFNLSIGVGCSDCACHPYGSIHAQCNDLGQCPCRAFATGSKCDRCAENHYYLKAGCLPCPPCYGLVQKRVNELRDKLARVFGGGVDQTKINQTMLLQQIMVLNKTVQEMYAAALDYSGVNSAVQNADRLSSTINDLLRQLNEIDQDINRYIIHKPACENPTLSNRLEELNQRMQGDVKQTVDDFKKKMETGKKDLALKELADNVTNTVQLVKTEVDNLSMDLKQTDGTLRTVLVNANALESDSLLSFKQLIMDRERMDELIREQSGPLKDQLKQIQQLSQEQRERLAVLNNELKKIPDIGSELGRLESVMEEWAGAKNKSEQLKNQLDVDARKFETHIKNLRDLQERLRAALTTQSLAAKDKLKIIRRLEDQLNQSTIAVKTAREAIENATRQLDNLRDFREYVERTKSELAGMDSMKEELKRDLEKLEQEVQGIHTQVAEALEAAKEVSKMANTYAIEIQKLKDELMINIEEAAAIKARQETISGRIYREMQPQIDKSESQLQQITPKAEEVIKAETRSTKEVQKLRSDVENLLKRMTDLKDTITNTGPDLDFTGDSSTRFKKVKERAQEMGLKHLLEELSHRNRSYAEEISFLSYELGEFRAQEKHLHRLNELLTQLKPSECFYSNKVIEGNPRARRRAYVKAGNGVTQRFSWLSGLRTTRTLKVF